MDQPFPSTPSFSLSENESDVNLIQFKTFWEAKNCLKKVRGLFLLPLRSLESGQKAVFFATRKDSKILPLALLVLGNCFVTIVAAQSLQIGALFLE